MDFDSLRVLCNLIVVSNSHFATHIFLAHHCVRACVRACLLACLPAYTSSFEEADTCEMTTKEGVWCKEEGGLG